MNQHRWNCSAILITSSKKNNGITFITSICINFSSFSQTVITVNQSCAFVYSYPKWTYSCREDQNNLGEVSVVGKVLGNSHQPTMLQNNTDCFTVNNSEQDMFMMSDNPAYGTVGEHRLQTILPSDHTYVIVDRLVGVVDNIKQKGYTFLHMLSFDIVSNL